MIETFVRWIRHTLPVKDRSERMEWTSTMKTRISDSEDAIRKIQHETDRLRQGNFMERELLERGARPWNERS
jgi:hypothetical protein